jgi:hypothetical protein
MAVYKLLIDEFDEIDYQLIAIHTPLEDYRLAYFINQKLPIKLKKSNFNIQISNKEGDTQFTRFIFEDEQTGISWDLIQNQNNILLANERTNQGLFTESNNNFSAKLYLLPEFKKVDFFLKIEKGMNDIDVTKITRNLKKIQKVNTVYPLDVEKIKSKNNLIF